MTFILTTLAVLGVLILTAIGLIIKFVLSIDQDLPPLPPGSHP